MKTLIFLLVLVAFVFAANAVYAESNLYLTVNGVSKHYNVDKDVFGDLNENNWGGGIEYEFSSDDRRILFLTAGKFRNSIRQKSNYGGLGAKVRLHLLKDPDLNLDAGLVLMGVNGYARGDRYFGRSIVYVLLPTISLGNKYMGINALFIPAVKDVTPATVGVQLKFRIIEF